MIILGEQVCGFLLTVSHLSHLNLKIIFTIRDAGLKTGVATPIQNGRTSARL